LRRKLIEVEHAGLLRVLLDEPMISRS